MKTPAKTREEGRAPVVRILGTRGVPAAYGGFETAAENVGLYLRDQGWEVIVYCQEPGDGPMEFDTWRGLNLVKIYEKDEGAAATIWFDLASVRHALAQYEEGEVWLTFGYNTGMFSLAPRSRGIPNVINMDGMEWKRDRWGPMARSFLLLNERLAGLSGTTLIGDHPVIARYLARHFGQRRVRTITYGAPEVEDAPTSFVRELGLVPGRYATVVCRPVAENSVLEIVSAWSRKPRGMKLLVVGPFGDDDPYQGAVRQAASAEVVFPGPIFDKGRLQALRFHGALYLHGHTVGGTNPSLVEAMGAGNPVVAHRNQYNTWVAGPTNAYFTGVEDLEAILDALLDDADQLARMGSASRERFREEFTWQKIGSAYESALHDALGSPPSVRSRHHDAAVAHSEAHSEARKVRV